MNILAELERFKLLRGTPRFGDAAVAYNYERLIDAQQNAAKAEDTSKKE